MVELEGGGRWGDGGWKGDGRTYRCGCVVALSGFLCVELSLA